MKFFAYAASICALFCAYTAAAQNPEDLKKEREFYEKIEEQVEQYRGTLKLEDWQVFYADSILFNNIKGRNDELKKLNDAKVTNRDLYITVADKWDEATYQAFKKILNTEQWDKYNRHYAGKAKKDRDKRAAKKS